MRVANEPVHRSIRLTASAARTALRAGCRDWPRLVLVAALLAVYAPVLWESGIIWLTGEYNTHGVLIFPLAGLLLWWRRHEIARCRKQSNGWGFAPLVGGLLLQMVAWYAGIRVLAMLSLVPVLLGLALLFGGSRMTRILLFPILFLGFAAPIPIWIIHPVSLPIQNLSCRAACWSVQQMGVPVSPEGFKLTLANGSVLEVAQECSGFKKTVTLSVFACFYASLFALPLWRQGLLVACAAPLAMLANVARVMALLLIANIWGTRAVQGLHDMADPLVVALSFLMLMGIGKALGCRKLRYSV